jgi:hypothetical protein
LRKLPIGYDRYLRNSSRVARTMWSAAMFATLLGTDRAIEDHIHLSDQLVRIAIDRGFVPPDNEVPVRFDWPAKHLDKWIVDQRGPKGGDADFLLSVMAPRVPAMSPVFPAYKTVEGPLFAVVILESGRFVISRQDRRGVSEVQDADAVARSFEQFLAGLSKEH